ncbi:hypothetical protein Ga0074812_102371 [Parafrankia irregularis]|uniref:Uncharacterized protein n=1 Tax=Parafrankia irregularis TaxID=795642 RepID=A0A0S4QGI4_9ACTN|nr:hypothetical protein FrEUN1fDRAFT_3743 [Parafrankia sp. EUN1f]CUU54361.1 hypothetical protein Ga0074812_102371 [Parafrankia irregularis]
MSGINEATTMGAGLALAREPNPRGGRRVIDP